MSITLYDIAKTLDHSTLQPFLTEDDIRKGCDVALQYDTATVCARPGDMPLVVRAPPLPTGLHGMDLRSAHSRE